MKQITKEQAIEALKEATNVKEWNEIRDKVFKQITQVEMAEIDGSGLIIEVLGKDTPHS